jgi:hypothetical protein
VSEEKPLHVKVAEALGMEPCTKWRPFNYDSMILDSGSCDHAGGKCYPAGGCPQYDTVWGAAGPLIEKYLVIIGPTWTDDSGVREVFDVPAGRRAISWSAWTHFPEGRIDGDGASPLIAVCNLILALKEAGKL